MKILSAEVYYSACWEGGKYVMVETSKGIVLLSMSEYEQIPNYHKPRG